MTEKDCFRTGIAVSLFAHFLFLLGQGPLDAPKTAFRTVVHMEMESAAASATSAKTGGVIEAGPQATENANTADQKRQAFLRYLDDIEETVHSLRLETSDGNLIGVATYSFIVNADGTFADLRLYASSGRPRLDAAAGRAVSAASGKVRRPAILGSEPIPVILQVKYQYGLR